MATYNNEIVRDIIISNNIGERNVNLDEPYIEVKLNKAPGNENHTTTVTPTATVKYGKDHRYTKQKSGNNITITPESLGLTPYNGTNTIELSKTDYKIDENTYLNNPIIIKGIDANNMGNVLVTRKKDDISEDLTNKGKPILKIPYGYYTSDIEYELTPFNMDDPKDIELIVTKSDVKNNSITITSKVDILENNENKSSTIRVISPDSIEDEKYAITVTSDELTDGEYKFINGYNDNESPKNYTSPVDISTYKTMSIAQGSINTNIINISAEDISHKKSTDTNKYTISIPEKEHSVDISLTPGYISEHKQTITITTPEYTTEIPMISSINDIETMGINYEVNNTDTSIICITPGTNALKIPKGTYIYNDIIIKGDSNLKSENIIKGTPIFGVGGELIPSALDGYSSSNITNEDLNEGKNGYIISTNDYGEKIFKYVEGSAKYNQEIQPKPISIDKRKGLLKLSGLTGRFDNYSQDFTFSADDIDNITAPDGNCDLEVYVSNINVTNRSINIIPKFRVNSQYVLLKPGSVINGSIQTIDLTKKGLIDSTKLCDINNPNDIPIFPYTKAEINIDTTTLNEPQLKYESNEFYSIIEQPFGFLSTTDETGESLIRKQSNKYTVSFDPKYLKSDTSIVLVEQKKENPNEIILATGTAELTYNADTKELYMPDWAVQINGEGLA